jgi:hypothetical protein
LYWLKLEWWIQRVKHFQLLLLLVVVVVVVNLLLRLQPAAAAGTRAREGRKGRAEGVQGVAAAKELRSQLQIGQ